MLITERLDKYRSKKYNKKFIKLGDFQVEEFKTKLREIAKECSKPKPISIKPITIDETQEEEKEKEMLKFDPSISPITMAQLRATPRLMLSRNEPRSLGRCFSQQSPVRPQKLDFKYLAKECGFRIDSAQLTNKALPKLRTLTRKDFQRQKFRLLQK